MSQDSALQGRVLLVDDDPDIRKLAGQALTEAGFSITEHPDGSQAAAVIRSGGISAMLLDLGLPGRQGLDVLREVRAFSDLPIIILTARGGEADRVIGLEMGADDYVVKPFSPRELAARVRSLLRRSTRVTAAAEVQPEVEFGPLVVDLVARQVRVDGALVNLTAREFDLLAFLACNPRQVFSREQLLEQVWGSSESWQSAATVNEHVYRLRQKLVAVGSSGFITTLRGIGYRFDPDLNC